VADSAPTTGKKGTDDVAGAARPAQTVEAPAESTGDDFPDPGPEAQAAPPPQVEELASACVRFVAASYGIALDYEPDTLSVVDQWLRDGRAEIAARPEAIDVVQAAAGAYFGEVMRRFFGASWVLEGSHASWKLCLSNVYCSFNPIGMAREALLLEAAEGWHAHMDMDPAERDAVEGRLAALPQVEPDEYYSPSTRFDVLCILVEALRAAMRGRGLGDVRFSADDYA
jgi:hypothetical protein